MASRLASSHAETFFPWRPRRLSRIRNTFLDQAGYEGDEPLPGHCLMREHEQNRAYIRD